MAGLGPAIHAARQGLADRSCAPKRLRVSATAAHARGSGGFLRFAAHSEPIGEGGNGSSPLMDALTTSFASPAVGKFAPFELQG